ncbi:FxsA family membrane protein [Actinacidiphila bryophytorum]|uniref:FxsA family membrane protein n=1 Tax=Actinacidiphila bryophytorum TaxID=1436133 RepID=UPI00195F4A3D|nr:FxsA family membrane protein [Actinacidiphila bryophytorum]MBM9437673.1 FxsA family protein [Actinacidiphila bryophytorum]MBN6547476.1 FxsA family protein [Actinacidiphila bryophytorum]
MTTSTPPPVRPRSAQQPRRRSRARTVVPLVIAAWAVLEIWLLTVVASATSGLVVLLCIVAGFVLGAAAVKRAGRSAWRNLTAAVQQQQAGAAAPAEVPAGGGRTGLHMLGGMLLIIPGFISDAVGLVLLFPPTRKLVGSLAERAAARSMRRHPGAADPGSLGDLFQQAQQAGEQSRIHRPDGKVIQGEVVDREGPRQN